MNFINVARAGVITDAPSISDVGVKILFFLLSVAGILAIIALAVSAVLYFTASGDEGRIEVAKRTATYAVVGIAVALGAMVLVNLIGQFFAA